MEKMNDADASALLAKYHIPLLRHGFAKNVADAAKAASRIGYPVALKASSPDIVHKTEVGGVVLGVKDETELKEKAGWLFAMMKKRKARSCSLIVQKMYQSKDSRELIAGGRVDEQFGPVVMFGLGGIFVELLGDVTFRLAPITKEDAFEMLEEINGKKLLGEFRGMKKVHKGAIASCLLSLGRLMHENPQIKEIDINPLFADDRGAYTGDFRVIVE